MIKVPPRNKPKYSSIIQFSVIKQIGEGGFSTVFLASDRRTNVKYAVKRITLSRLTPRDYENVEKEILIHSQLSHQNIINLVDYFVERGYVYLIMEHCPKGNLFFYLREKKVLSEEMVRKITRQTAEGLKYIHSKGFIMRDLKPENILLDNNLNVKICDFGWAADLSDHKYCSVRAGTFIYMSPESLVHRHQNEKSDIWCLGVLLYELFFNYEPFNGKTTEEQVALIVNKKLDFSERKVSKEVKQLINEILTFEPHKRPSLDSILNSKFLKPNQQPSLLECSRIRDRIKNINRQSDKNMFIKAFEKFEKKKKGLKKEDTQDTIDVDVSLQKQYDKNTLYQSAVIIGKKSGINKTNKNIKRQNGIKDLSNYFSIKPKTQILTSSFVDMNSIFNKSPIKPNKEKIKSRNVYMTMKNKGKLFNTQSSSLMRKKLKTLDNMTEKSKSGLINIYQVCHERKQAKAIDCDKTVVSSSSRFSNAYSLIMGRSKLSGVSRSTSISKLPDNIERQILTSKQEQQNKSHSKGLNLYQISCNRKKRSNSVIKALKSIQALKGLVAN